MFMEHSKGNIQTMMPEKLLEKNKSLWHHSIFTSGFNIYHFFVKINKETKKTYFTLCIIPYSYCWFPNYLIKKIPFIP